MPDRDRQDPQVKASSAVIFYRIMATLLIASVLGVWIMMGMRILVDYMIPLVVTGVCGVGWVVLMILSSRHEARSGLRPDGGIRWDGNIANPDDENPANR